MVLTRYGVVELSLFSGRCRTTGKFEMPFKTLCRQGERHPVSPLLERKIVTTVCETGSFEKTAKVCAEWGCEISDDKAMSTIRNVGASCADSDLPELCEDAATSEDILIVMMDGWPGSVATNGAEKTRRPIRGSPGTNASPTWT